MSDQMTLRGLLERTVGTGEAPTEAEIKEVITGRSEREMHQNRDGVLRAARKIAALANDGLSVRAEDLAEATMLSYGRTSRRASDKAASTTPTELAATWSRSQPSVKDKDGHRRYLADCKAAREQLAELLNRAAEGEKITDADVRAMTVKEEVTDAEYDRFRAEVLRAAEQIRAYRGDLLKRDGRHARTRNARDVAEKYTDQLYAAGVLDAPQPLDPAEGITDPAELAALVLQRPS